MDASNVQRRSSSRLQANGSALKSFNEAYELLDKIDPDSEGKKRKRVDGARNIQKPRYFADQQAEDAQYAERKREFKRKIKDKQRAALDLKRSNIFSSTFFSSTFATDTNEELCTMKAIETSKTNSSYAYEPQHRVVICDVCKQKICVNWRDSKLRKHRIQDAYYGRPGSVCGGSYAVVEICEEIATEE